MAGLSLCSRDLFFELWFAELTRFLTLGSRGSNDDGNTGVDDDTQVIESDQGNVLSHLISQLRPGADLSRVTLPTFILEPRSMLERITKYDTTAP